MQLQYHCASLIFFIASIIHRGINKYSQFLSVEKNSVGAVMGSSLDSTQSRIRNETFFSQI